MGCDIHAHVETRHVKQTNDQWSHLCDFRFGRNYLLFALMAGVRRYNYMPDAAALEKALKKRGVEHLNDPLLSEAESQIILQEASDSGITCGQPSFEEKGIPRDISWKTAEEYTMYVVDDDDEEENEDNCCARSRAMRWIADNSSEAWDTIDGKVVRVTNPDWHTASWLDTSEMVTLAERLSNVEKADATYFDKNMSAKVEGLVEMMKRLEADGSVKARVVFWFDN